MRRLSGSALALAALIGAGAAARPLAAQAAGTLAGAVTDARSGTPVPHATVLVAGTQGSAVTDTAGRYAIGPLAPGRYTVRVLAIGFEPAIRDDVVVAPGAPARADFALRRAAVELPGVVVSASRAPTRSGDVPVSVAVLSHEDLARRNVVTLDEALKYEPGVIFQHGALDIRGASGIAGGVASRVLLLVDDHPLLTGATREVDFDILPVLDIDRVEVVRGPASALYGSNALGGVVNVITRPIAPSPTTTVRGYYGAFDPPAADRFTDRLLDLKGVQVEHDQPIGDFGTRLYAERVQSDGFEQNGGVSRWLGRAEVAYPNGGPLPMEVYALWSQEDAGNFFVWRDSTARDQVPANQVGDWYRSQWVNLGATLIPAGSPSLLLRVSPYFYYAAVRNHYSPTEPDSADFHHSSVLGADVQLSINPAAEHALVLGGLIERTGVTSNTLGDHAEYDVALYGQDEAGLLPHLTATLGARLDHHAVAGGVTQTVLSPKLGLVYRVSPTVSARASLAHGFRAPAPVEQFVNAEEAGYPVVPNPTLRPERTWSAEVGTTATLDGWLWLDGALFDSEYYDLIDPAPAPGYPFGTFQFQNVERSRVRGADVEARIALPSGMDLHVTYDFLHTKDLNTGLPLPYRSTHNLGATLAGHAWGFDWALDGLYRSRIAQVLLYPLDPRGDIGLLGARLARQVGGWDVQGKVTNLLQARYVDVQERTPGAPRRFLVSVTRSF